MVMGMNAELVILASPFLPRRADHFPRFRDVVPCPPELGDIAVLTRMGGINRACREEHKEGRTCVAHDAMALEKDPRCCGRFDMPGDSTYCLFVFRVADEDKADLAVLQDGRPWDLSERYKTKLRELFAPDGEKTRDFVEVVCTLSAPG